MKILLVEDDDKTAGFIVKGLGQEGFTVDRADNGRNGLFLALDREYDVAVIDIMLPGMDGLQLISMIRDAGSAIPILILSARSTVDDRVRGLKGGGDDYLVKPFSFSELVARIQALARRHAKPVEREELVVADLNFDLIRRRVTRQNDAIDLQPLELSLLEFLMRNAGRVVSKTSIIEYVWDYHFDPQANIVEVRICRLREKIDKPYEVKLIKTVRGCGYVLGIH